MYALQNIFLRVQYSTSEYVQYFRVLLTSEYVLQSSEYCTLQITSEYCTSEYVLQSSEYSDYYTSYVLQNL